RRRHLQPPGEVAAEAGGVELRPQAEHALPRQTAALHGEVGQHVDRVADDQDIRVVLEADLLDLVEDADEEVDVAADEVEAALVGLAAQAGGDDDDVAAGDLVHAAGADALVGDEAGAVEQVGRLALGEILVGVDEADAADDAAALQGERGRAADQATAADDADFHGSSSGYHTAPARAAIT